MNISVLGKALFIIVQKMRNNFWRKKKEERNSNKGSESVWAVGYQKKPGPSAGRENERNRLDMRDHLNLFEKETWK